MVIFDKIVKHIDIISNDETKRASQIEMLYDGKFETIYTASSIPDQYIVVPWVRNAVNAGIDTGIPLDDNLKIKVKYDTSFSTQAETLYGIWNGNDEKLYYLISSTPYRVQLGLAGIESNYVAPGWDGSTTIGVNNSISTEKTPITAIIDYQNWTWHFEQDGQVADGSLTADKVYKSLGLTIPLFIRRRGANSYDRPFRGLVYECSMYISGVLVRDFIPVYDTISGKYGMFDKVESKYYAPFGGDLLGAPIN